MLPASMPATLSLGLMKSAIAVPLCRVVKSLMITLSRAVIEADSDSAGQMVFEALRYHLAAESALPCQSDRAFAVVAAALCKPSIGESSSVAANRIVKFSSEQVINTAR